MIKKGIILAHALALLAAGTAEARTARETYATCYNLRGHTASGFSLARNTRAARRTAASNVLRLGTHIRLVGRHAGPTGVRRYVVRDTGGALGDGHLDLWNASCSGWPNPPVKYRLGW
jgi:3D (Asp-Asp-Asp) domain-containing protein